MSEQPGTEQAAGSGAESAPPERVDPAAFPGEPDGMQRLWTPHRMAYIGGENKPTDPDDGEQCPFCAGPRRDDEDALIVHRGEVAYVILNLYPYNTGHLMVCPYRHVADYTELTGAEVAEVAELTRTAMRVVRAVSNPAGFNLGMNQGEVAGAGISTTCTNTWYRAGWAMRTSCPSSAAPRPCRCCWPTPARSTPRPGPRRRKGPGRPTH